MSTSLPETSRPIELIGLFWQYRVQLFSAALAVTLCALVAAVLMPRHYTATTLLYAPLPAQLNHLLPAAVPAGLNGQKEFVITETDALNRLYQNLVRYASTSFPPKYDWKVQMQYKEEENRHLEVSLTTTGSGEVPLNALAEWLDSSERRTLSDLKGDIRETIAARVMDLEAKIEQLRSLARHRAESEMMQLKDELQTIDALLLKAGSGNDSGSARFMLDKTPLSLLSAEELRQYRLQDLSRIKQIESGEHLDAYEPELPQMLSRRDALSAIRIGEDATLLNTVQPPTLLHLSHLKKQAVIVLAGLMLGLLLGVIWVLLLHAIRRQATFNAR